MAIIQISKIQHRSGNLVDLPQLDSAELGWANDHKRLFIGTSLPNPDENIEVLTSYSNVSFSQIDGSAAGNLNIDPLTVSNGQVLAFDGNNWVNRGTGAPGILTLGDASNVQITGGAVGYVLETDGYGNLSWTSKGTIRTNIIAMSNATPVIMTVANTTPYTNGASVTISGVQGANANTIVNGQMFYVKLSTDFPISGNVKLYTDTGLVTGLVGTNLAATPNTGVATTSLGGGSSVTGAGGSNTTIQFNNTNLLDGSANLVYDFANSILTQTGNANIIGNVNVTGAVTSSTLSSNVAIGTPPLTVVSTTLVPNLRVARASLADSSAVTNQTTGVFFPTLVSSNATANYALNASGGLSFNAATGALTATQLTGTLTTGAQPNITSTGTLSSLAVTGNISAGNISGGNLVSATYLSGTLITGAQPNITSTGTLSSLNVSGNANVGNLGTSGLIVATGNITGGNFTTAGQIMVTGNVTANNFIGNVIGNISGNLSVAGANTQVVFNDAGIANANAGFTFNKVSGLVSVTGNITGGNLTTAGRVQTPILTTGSNVTAGTITGNWSLSTGSLLQSTYADLAEYYVADAFYPPGTVLAFGGDEEVTLADDGTTRIAGVVTTNPAYVMNSACAGEHIVALALQGRTPCMVKGNILKGDMLVSGGGGFARPSNNPTVGTIIGKALANFNGEGQIEVAVGRL